MARRLIGGFRVHVVHPSRLILKFKDGYRISPTVPAPEAR